jgi:alpha-L-rhamnosidase
MMRIHNLFKNLAVAMGLLLIFPTCKALQPDRPTFLRCCDKPNPVCSLEDPYFGWYFNDPDDNETQTAYQILVASSLGKIEAHEADMWDSKKTNSDQQNYIYYEGKGLEPGQQYFWKVRTWDKDGQPGPFSEVAVFGAPLLSHQDWDGAKWIKRDNNQADDYTYYRKKFSLGKQPIKRAVVYVTASHDYELYLNGQLIGKGPAYHYPQYQYYNAFDVTQALKQGAENLFASLTHWYGGGQGRPKSARGFLLKTIIEFEGGLTETIGTDGSWKQMEARYFVSGQPKRNGEGIGFIDKLDANEMLPGWNMLGFDDTGWEYATEIGPVPTAPWTGILQPDLTSPIEVTIEPVDIQDLGNGRYVIDFGKIYPGMPYIEFTGGEKGQEVNMLGGFVLTPDKTVDPKINQKTKMQYSVVLNGETSVFSPMVYLGMQYLQVENSPCVLTKNNVKFIVRYYELDQNRSSFESSDPMLNQVWQLMKHSLIAGSQETFVDTPTREKGGFLGDAWSQGVPCMTVMGDRLMNQRILLEFLDSQDQYWPDGRLNAVYPNADGARDIPDYTQSYLVWAWDYYMQTGNIEFLKKYYSKLKKVADYVYNHVNDTTGLVHYLTGGRGPYEFGIIDWPKEMRYGYDMETASRTVVNAYAYIDFKIISDIAGWVGMEGDSILFGNRAKAMKDKINSLLINRDGVYIDGLKKDHTQSTHASQHANAFPLAMGIVPGPNREKVVALVKGRAMNMGMVTLRWLPEALGKAGEAEHLIELYTNTAWDGWAKTIAHGGTVTWESWDALEHNYSLSHPWGAVGLLAMQEYMLGLQVLEPQHALIQVKPLAFGERLTHVKGTLPSDRGNIYVEWKKEGEVFTLSVTIPDNVKANVYLPKYGAADKKTTMNGKETGTEALDGYVLIRNVGSGSYTFVR